MSHAHAPHAKDGEADEIKFTQEFWDDRYRSRERMFSGQPNAQLVAQAADLTPGTALDAGCGEGADAIWLARRGWTVTGVDVSAVALERAAGDAVAAGEEAAGRITWQREDLLTWGPQAGSFDLVTASFMHLPADELGAMHRRLAAGVRSGGTFLLILHHPDDLHANVGRAGQPELFASARDMAAVLDPEHWEIVTSADVERAATDMDGHPATVKDTVLRARRR